MSNNKEKVTKKFFVSEALIIACSPLVAYLFTFAYEAGFVKVFKIPVQMVTLNLTTVFVAASALIVALSILPLFLNFFYMITVNLFKGKEAIMRRIIGISPVFMWVLGLLWLFGTTWEKWI